MNKYISHLSIASVAIVLAACGGGGGGNNNDDDVAVIDNTIRGIIDTTLPSAALPANAIASAALPSDALPSGSLPSIEIDESPVAIAALRTLEVTLQQSQEVTVTPLAAGNDNLTATAELLVNETTGAITGVVTASNLDEADAITMVHIHSGFAGSNGPVIINFVQTDNPLVFTLNANITDLSDFPGNDLETFLDGGWYFNLHTESNPSGQLRGQIFTNDADVVRVEMESRQEVTADSLPEERSTAGVAYFTFDTDEADDGIIANVQAFGFEATVAHIHAGFAGQNGPVIIGLNDISDDIPNAATGTFFRTAPDAEFINRTNALNGAYYFNAHSAANPAGEVRGQILPGEANVERVLIQTAQEVPAVVTPSAANVSGVGYVTTNGASFINSNVQVDGFVPSLPAAPSPVHIHTGFAGTTGPIVVILDEVIVDDVENTFFRATADAGAGFVSPDFDAGRNYINVHSDANPSGEIRGQLTPAATQAVRVELSADQELVTVSDDNPDASAIAYVTINQTPTETTVVANAQTSGFEAVEPGPGLGPVHLHDNFAGQNGPIIITLDDTAEAGADVTQGSFFESNAGEPIAVPDEDVTDFLNGGYYFNIHSAANVPGELRGQVTPEGVKALITTLQGQQENPPVINAAGIAGTGFLTFNTVNANVVANVRVVGFVPELAALIGPVHIHNGFAGENGPVVLPLLRLPGEGENYRGTQANILPGQTLDFERLLQGGNYYNVHSAANPTGEIRGQLVPAGIEALRSELQGQQENPPVINEAGISGVGYATVDAQNEKILLNVTVAGFVPFLDAPVGPVHLHDGFAGINGPVILPLSPVGDSEVSFTGTEADILADQTLDFAQLLQGGHYINVHSAANASGEIRGQVVTSNNRVLRAELDGSQALPPTESLGTGIGYLTVTDFINGQFLSNATINGLIDPTVAVNVGGPNNVFLTELLPATAPDSFTSVVRAVANLNALLNNNAYAFEAIGEDSE